MLNLGIDASMLTTQRSGIGNYVYNLLTEYLKVKGDTRIVLFSDRGVAEDARHFGEVVENIGPPIRKGPLWLSSGLYPLLKQKSIDVFWGGNGYVPLAVPRGIRRVLTIHDMVAHEAPQTMLTVSFLTRRIFQTLAILQADRIITVSHSTAGDLARHTRGRSDLIIPPLMNDQYGPATPAAIEAVRQRHLLPDRYLLAVGTVEPRKNLLRTVRAHADLRRQGVALPQLIIAGHIGWKEQDIAQEIEEMAREGHVRYLGYVPIEDMPGLYAGAIALLFLPVYEGYGMPAREALLCGTPVIASDIPALREATEGNALFIGYTQAEITQALRLWAEGALVAPPSALHPDRAAGGEAARAFKKALER